MILLQFTIYWSYALKIQLEKFEKKLLSVLANTSTRRKKRKKTNWHLQSFLSHTQTQQGFGDDLSVCMLNFLP